MFMVDLRSPRSSVLVMKLVYNASKFLAPWSQSRLVYSCSEFIDAWLNQFVCITSVVKKVEILKNSFSAAIEELTMLINEPINISCYFFLKGQIDLKNTYFEFVLCKLVLCKDCSKIDGQRCKYLGPVSSFYACIQSQRMSYAHPQLICQRIFSGATGL